MPGPEPKVDAYAESVEAFAKPILAHLRGVVRSTCPEVVETLKWGIPHFDYRGEMMCIFAAYKSHCAFSFWKSSLMSDPRLKASVDLPSSKRFMGKLTSLADLPVDAELIAWIREAMVLNEQGAKVAPRTSSAPAKTVVAPSVFVDRLAASPSVKTIFESKSASFRKEYIVWIADAKTEATRDKRIDEALAWIAEGKGRFWKYAKGG
ncbi:YdeI/OmpD-associated family protein [Bosea sp. LjRoot9]|uniref:DUF1801 domain-containing protein n=1 Tax=Bosea sp. LjRoot9 TaxID=3342341 RepID=UPI003ECD992B